MIQHIENLLRRWGWIPPFDADDVLNAQLEDKARDNEKVVARLRKTLTQRLEVNEHLRKSIQIAKRRTNSFEEFERLTHNGGGSPWTG